mmetsp:Transcript_76869/g.89309  ORF Transcript_76869/g.89309 Transcript_76869/m.89309 type:complete len:96 (-) Transcript_76869:266-553(-)
MSYAPPGKKVKKMMTNPVSLLFRFFQTRVTVQVWLYENVDSRIEGVIIGFDEYMNLTLDNAEEINTKKDTRRKLGRIILKGDNITLIRNVGDVDL